VLMRDKNYAKKFSGFVFVDTVYNHGNGVVLLYLPGDSAMQWVRGDRPTGVRQTTDKLR